MAWHCVSRLQSSQISPLSADVVHFHTVNTIAISGISWFFCDVFGLDDEATQASDECHRANVVEHEEENENDEETVKTQRPGQRRRLRTTISKRTRYTLVSVFSYYFHYFVPCSWLNGTGTVG